VVALLELALGDAGERVDDADADVFLANVTIVVCKYFEDVLRVLAQTVEEVKDAVFAIVLGVAGVEHSEEEIVDEDADGLLEVLAEVEEEQMEYGHCPREDLLLGGDRELKQGTAERVADCVHEFSAMHEGLARVLEARVDQIEAQEHLPHVVNIVKLSIEVLALQQLAELVEDQESIASMWLVDCAWT
jgi:hypothetical protein